MKACKYCGIEVENTKKKCPNCGSTELLRVCDNCGEHFDGNFCPKCGVKVGQKEKTCPECKTVYYTNACPNCGYTPTRKAPAEQTVVHNHVYVSAPQTKSTPVTKAAPKKPEKKKGKKHRLLWLLAFVILIAVFGGNSGNNKSKKTVNESVVTAVPVDDNKSDKATMETALLETELPEVTETVTEEPIATETPEPAPTDTQAPEVTATAIPTETVTTTPEPTATATPEPIETEVLPAEPTTIPYNSSFFEENVDVLAVSYADDSVVNRFIQEYNLLYDDKITEATPGNIKTKYFIEIDGLYTELINANDAQANYFSVSINGNADTEVKKLINAFTKVAKVLEPSIDDKSLLKDAKNLTSGKKMKTLQIGDSLEVTYFPAGSWSGSRIDIKATKYK